MWWLAVGLAWAQPPAGVDLEDLDRWEASADLLLDGPRGCWEMVGEARWDWDAGRLGANRGSAVFAGRMDDGEWGELYVRSLGEVARPRGRGPTPARHYVDAIRFIPLVGTVDAQSVQFRSGRDTEIRAESSEGGPANPNNVVRSMLDAVSGSVDIAWASWDSAQGGVRLHRAVPIGDGKRAPEAEVQVFYPDGQDLPSAMDVRFPERFFRGALPRVKVEDAQVQVRGRRHGDTVFPTMESFRFTLGVLGISVEGAQTITYTSAVPCPPAAELALPAAEDPEPRRAREGDGD